MKQPSLRQPKRGRSPIAESARPARRGGNEPPSMADGLLPILVRPEKSEFASLLYPLRGAECLGVIAALGMGCWIFFTLVPEYCLTLIGDADSMGVTKFGYFIALISMLPVLFLSPFALFFWLQYFGRVLVASAIGETAPPRSPDRNFDGFFTGMSAWLIWLALGVGVGLLPLAVYVVAMGSIDACNRWLAIGLVLLAVPYMLMALMMTFLHDDGLAAKPWSVIAALFQVGGSFCLRSLFITAAVMLSLATFLIALLLRERLFWIYLVVCLGCWIAVHWTSFVVARLLGTYYFHRRDVLRWHHERPRWGVTWKL
jgi:hypothetical protein